MMRDSLAMLHRRHPASTCATSSGVHEWNPVEPYRQIFDFAREARAREGSAGSGVEQRSWVMPSRARSEAIQLLSNVEFEDTFPKKPAGAAGTGIALRAKGARMWVASM